MTPEPSTRKELAWYLKALASRIHLISAAKGFWDEGRAGRNKAEMIALMHSELSEALEAIRSGNPPDKHLPDFDSLTVEMADTVIRILDFCHAFDLPLAAAVLAKVEYNADRPHKHGKAF